MIMNFQFKLDGTDDLIKKLQNVAEQFPQVLTASTDVVTNEIAEDAKQNHTFQNITGNLEASITNQPATFDGTNITGYVSAGMEYSAWVEFGTSKAAPYPYLTPAIESNRNNFNQTMIATINKAHNDLLCIKS
jgi:HK97 gp10 family phage protein